jgi:hypothetical protein
LLDTSIFPFCPGPKPTQEGYVDYFDNAYYKGVYMLGSEEVVISYEKVALLFIWFYALG